MQDIEQMYSISRHSILTYSYNTLSAKQLLLLFIINMQKYQVIIQFEMDEHFMSFVPPHRTYINYLINKQIIDSYAVSMETQHCWIIINADDKMVVDAYLTKSPLYKYWTYNIEELFVYDSQLYRLPTLQLN